MFLSAKKWTQVKEVEGTFQLFSQTVFYKHSFWNKKQPYWRFYKIYGHY